MLSHAGAIQDSIECEGFTIVESFAPGDIVEKLLSALDREVLRERAGVRQLHEAVPEIASFLRSDFMKRWVEWLIPGGFPVRSILFDKTVETNWHVPWHQDLSICVKQRHEVPGFGAWSVKEGVLHVQPPTGVLQRMLTVRLHLDDCGPDNGPLRVIPGSHRHSRLSAEQIGTWRKNGPIKTCAIPSGGAMIMKPLLLHSSSSAAAPEHRRVLHIEFASEALPQPLEWIS